MHSWIFRHLLELEEIYGRRNLQRPKPAFVPPGPHQLPIRVLIPLPRVLAPGKSA
jgi:hypothetical protein